MSLVTYKTDWEGLILRLSPGTVQIGNLMERLLNLNDTNRASIWRNHSQGNVFGYIQDRLGRINIEIVTWHCSCRWIARITDLKMAVTDNYPAKSSSGRGFVYCKQSVLGPAGTRLIDHINRTRVRGHNVVE